MNKKPRACSKVEYQQYQSNSVSAMAGSRSPTSKSSTMFTSVALICVTLIGAALAGCGWRLQGAARLSPAMRTIYVETSDVYTDFYREVVRLLRENGANVVGTSATAQSVLRIREDKFGQRVLSVSSRNTPEQYQVYYSVSYSVTVGGREALAPLQKELTGNYSFDSSAMLAKQREQAAMQRALARELASQVLLRMATVGDGATRTAVP